MADYKKSSVHCHSTMCDGKNTLQEMASAACAQGLTTLGFTGHSYTQRDREYCMSPSRTAQYKATIAKLKTEYKGKVDILCGIEWDLLSEDKRTGYDYWIGSAHHLYGKNTGQILRDRLPSPGSPRLHLRRLRRRPAGRCGGILRRGGEGGCHGSRHPGPHRPHQEAERCR